MALAAHSGYTISGLEAEKAEHPLLKDHPSGSSTRNQRRTEGKISPWVASSLWLEAVRKRRDPHLNPTPLQPNLLGYQKYSLTHTHSCPQQEAYLGPQSAYHKLREKNTDWSSLPGAAAMARVQVTKGTRAARGTALGVISSAASPLQLLRDVSPTQPVQIISLSLWTNSHSQGPHMML